MNKSFISYGVQGSLRARIYLSKSINANNRDMTPNKHCSYFACECETAFKYGEMCVMYDGCPCASVCACVYMSARVCIPNVCLDINNVDCAVDDGEVSHEVFTLAA